MSLLSRRRIFFFSPHQLHFVPMVDLMDAVAERLHQPGHILSPEMLYRKLYYLYTNYQTETGTDLVAYLAAQDTGLDEAPHDRRLRKHC